MGSPGFNWRDALSAGFQGVAGAAGNQQLYDQIQQQRDQKKQQADAMRQAALTKVGLAQQRINDMLASGMHPQTGAPLSDMERANLTQTQQTLKDYAHQIATGQPPQKQSAQPPPTTTATPSVNLGYGVNLPGGSPKTVSLMIPQQSRQNAQQAVAQYTANVPANPTAQKYNQIRQAFPDIQPEEAMHMALGSTPKTVQDKLISQWEAAGMSPEQALQKWTDITKPEKEKTAKGLKPLEGGIGVKDEDTGTSYFPSQANDPSIPQPARDMLKAQQVAKTQKDLEENRKEDLRLKMQANTLGAIAGRMGQSEQFQEAMTDFHSDLSTYRALDKQADDSKSIIEGLKQQYAQPGNHAVADNELQNFYTTIVQKGGRKTAAEFALTAKIGSFGMNLDQMIEKAKTGQLPDALRRDLLSGMQAVAKEQRQEADAAKPELPELPTRSGTKKKPAASSGNSKDPFGVL